MRELVLRVGARAVEPVLDRLLPLLPGGVREIPDGDHVELRMSGDDLPTRAEIARHLQRWPHSLRERQVADDWRARRLAEYRQAVIGGRLVVRPDWAPPAGPGLIDIALSDDTAFGSGAHPSTNAILLALLALEPLGSFADLGCGSGVLGILAAKLGWTPVCGLEIVAASAASARANVRRNGVEMEVSLGDLTQRPPPPTIAFAANIPGPVHLVLAKAVELQAASWGILSGFGPDREDELVTAYAAAGLAAVERQERYGWSVITLQRR